MASRGLKLLAVVTVAVSLLWLTFYVEYFSALQNKHPLASDGQLQIGVCACVYVCVCARVCVLNCNTGILLF